MNVVYCSRDWRFKGLYFFCRCRLPVVLAFAAFQGVSFSLIENYEVAKVAAIFRVNRINNSEEDIDLPNPQNRDTDHVRP